MKEEVEAPQKKDHLLPKNYIRYTNLSCRFDTFMAFLHQNRKMVTWETVQTLPQPLREAYHDMEKGLFDKL